MEDYKTRFVKEYEELKNRYERLYKIIVKYEARTLDFELNCPIDLLKRQEELMLRYLTVLEIRAEIEDIVL